MMKVKSFAKVNLMLKVIKKREDGYHELQMLNKRIPLFDEIVITKSENDEIVFIHEEVDPTYLYNVLKQIKNIYNIEKNYQIVITKNIPLGSGLGGASMNATTIINAMSNTMLIAATPSWRLYLSTVMRVRPSPPW